MFYWIAIILMLTIAPVSGPRRSENLDVSTQDDSISEPGPEVVPLCCGTAPPPPGGKGG